MGGVSFHNAHGRFDDAGGPTDAAGSAAAAESLLRKLLWWARLLRTARLRVPYPG